MDKHHNTPPYSGPNTPNVDPTEIPTLDPATPTRLTPMSTGHATQKLNIPENLTQADVDADPHHKRLQRDLLILTSFNEGSTLHWRPLWFTSEDKFPDQSWTLFNPPDVVTEFLPSNTKEKYPRQVHTRRMRRPEDPEPSYIKTWEHWERVCELRGVPRDVLCEEHVRLMRLGVPRDGKGGICAPPNWPLYPEPQRPGLEPYTLRPEVYASHLPSKFRNLVNSQATQGVVKQVEVHSNGAIAVKECEGHVHTRQDRKWNWVPWTTEQEESCEKVYLRVRLWDEAMRDEEACRWFEGWEGSRTGGMATVVGMERLRMWGMREGC
ncbi:hypothetical protein EK21DRAFT_61407 [Setomelanomma holmii]|uniref:Uncharacterized protein n=1 Tax=Setomelanomma holmii TaxID=210430 RepID=A0A9P4LQ03_9PLEO|nr:hypothetical protein EK21DRAFT_61407 [Setomelanomma holmii]